MLIKDTINHLDNRHNGQLGEAFRFICVGVIATLLQYGVYWALTKLFADSTPTGKSQFYSSVFMTAAYLVSFVFNFIASTRYTFKVKANARRGAGFAFSHVVNWALQMGTLNLFLWLGLGKTLAPIPMFAICIPVNFLLVRYFLKDKK